MEPDFGKSKVSALKKSDVKQFYNILADERGLQISTIDSVHTVLHQVLDMAVDDCYLRSNPSDNVLRELKKRTNLKPPTAKRLLFRSRIYYCPTFPKHRSTSTGIRIFAVMLGTVCVEKPPVCVGVMLTLRKARFRVNRHARQLRPP